MIVGAAATSVCGILISALNDSWAPAAATGFILLVVGVRIHLIREYQRRAHRDNPAEVRWLERTYVISASAYLLGIGLLAFSAFATSDDPFVLTLACCGALSQALSVAVRNFAVRNGVGLQISAVALPLAAGFLVRGGLFPLLIPLLLVPFSLFIYVSASRLRDILLSEIGFRSQSQKIAQQFDFAINNMSHGMCMVSGEGKVLVCNSRFSDFVGFSPTTSLVNARLESILRVLGRRGAAPGESLTRLRRLLDVTTLQGEPCSIEFETLDDCVYELTVTPNSRGGWVIVIQDITAKRDADRAIDHMAHFNSVTNLRNRRSFELALTEALRNEDRRLTVMFLDLDDFKQVNDTLGHRTGDKLLAEIARRIKGVVEAGALVARWGGDEFVILRYDAHGDNGELARRIIDEVSRPVVIDGSEVVVGASIGGASAPDDGTSADTLLSNADIALYAAKGDGRRGWRPFEPAMDTKIQVRRLIELELRAAVATETIDVHFQPIVDVASRHIVGFEALSRWRHPTRGAVSPAEFIPILEDIGLIEELGASVLRRACAACASWPPEMAVSVNLSPSQFRSGKIEATIRDALNAAGLAPQRLDLEITESTLLEDRGGDARRTLQALRTLGVRISLDDFGTGYSSLSYLLSFPLDRIKIDRSFTVGLGLQERASILVESVATMARRLGMSVLVEGVETERQMRLIEELGTIEEVQGFLFSPPVPQSELPALIGARPSEGRAAA